jgi:hypothetical protein
MVNALELREVVDAQHEWLLVRGGGRSFPLLKHEVEVIEDGEKVLFGFLDENGFHSWRLNGFRLDADEIEIDVAGSFAKNRETLRLIPRTSAVELSAEVEIARLKRANDIAELITQNFPYTRLNRVALNEPGGRLAQITFDREDKTPCAAIADVTNAMTAESLFTASMLWTEKLATRKKPILDLWVICEKRQARNARKLLALLSSRWKAKLTIVEIDRKADPPRLVLHQAWKLSDLWREKAPKLTLPREPQPSVIAEAMLQMSPENTDLIYSRNGETIRFCGLPFARVRTMMGIEKAWFGVGRERRPVNNENWPELEDLVADLEQNRRPEPDNKRHEYYRTASEAWLESILRRDITLLDANLVLSPIYNQFRSFTDKIDLLALRRDGRLVIIELKTQPDREMVFQAVDYWRKIELQRRRGLLAAANLFEGREISDKPAIIYLAAPAWSFHRDFEYFARSVSPEIEVWRFDLHENWREEVKVVARTNCYEKLA